MSDLSEFIQDFVAECREGLEQLDTEMIELERNPEDTARLDRIFRTLHTIKGNCGFLDFDRLGRLAHAGETLLGRLRERQVAFSSAIADVLLQLVDAIRDFVNRIAAGGTEGDADHAPLCQTLLRLADASKAAGPALEKQVRVNPQTEERDRPDQRPVSHRAVERVSTSGPPAMVEADDTATPAADASLAREDIIPAEYNLSETHDHPARIGRAATGSRLSAATTGRPGPSSTRRTEPASEQPARVSGSGSVRDVESPLTLNKEGSVGNSVAEEAQSATPKPAQSGTDAAAGLSESATSSTVRIQVGLLERLMNLIGELVLTRNQLLQRVARLSDPTTSLITQRLNSITTELQEEFMRTRMVRIGTVWQRFPRIVRDTARKCGKDVRLVTEGDSTELDRTLVEAISDPLTHLIRNAVDHGIERPHERYARGKSKQGTLALRAFHEGGQVHIEVSDDGAGIDAEKVRRRAVQAGLFSQEESLVMDEAELRNSIFLPGFTTAEAITDLSGRGVGMDVVKTSIEQVGGIVQVHSQPGIGTTVRLTVPLTMAIIPALIIHNAGQQYAVPQVSLNELLRLSPDEASQRIDSVQGVSVLRLRGRLLPLIRLNEVLRTAAPPAPPTDICVLVLRVANQTFGLIVDAVSNNEEIVVKPLVPLLQGLPAYAGSTLLGDGSLALILDVQGLARISGVLERAVTAFHVEAGETSGTRRITDLSAGLLLCELGSGQRVAFAVPAIRRLEEFSADGIEQAAHRSVIQYRSDVLPLLDVHELLYASASADRSTGTSASAVPVDPDAGREQWPVVVCATETGEIGCRVSRVIDIAVAPRQTIASNAPGISASAVIDGRMTDLLDVDQLATLSRCRTGSAGGDTTPELSGTTRTSGPAHDRFPPDRTCSDSD